MQTRKILKMKIGEKCRRGRFVNLLDGKNSAVHHVGGSNDICPSLDKGMMILYAIMLDAIILDAIIFDAIILDEIILDAINLDANNNI